MPSIGQENLEAVMIDSGPMPQRLRRPRPEVESIIDRAIEKGNELLEGATDVGYEDSYEAWVRWHADTREALNAAFEGDEMEASTTTSPRAVRSTSGPAMPLPPRSSRTGGRQRAALLTRYVRSESVSSLPRFPRPSRHAGPRARLVRCRVGFSSFTGEMKPYATKSRRSSNGLTSRR
jgi:hypothetical protein